MIKTTKTFADFNTCFLQLARQAVILTEDLMLDLFKKLMLKLQRATLPYYSDMISLKVLTEKCLNINQGLRRIRACADCLKARNSTNLPVNRPQDTARRAAVLYNQNQT